MSTSRLHSTPLLAFALATFSSLAAAQQTGQTQPGTNVPTPAPATAPVTTTADPSPMTTVSPIVADPNEPVIDATTTRTTFLNRPLFLTGLILFAGSYGASAAVGATTDRADDKKLIYPVAGPWMDLTNRDCGGQACEQSDTHKALLIGSGVVQGLGALGLVMSLVIPEKTTRRWYLIGSEGTHIGPTLVGRSAYGLGAYGSF